MTYYKVYDEALFNHVSICLMFPHSEALDLSRKQLYHKQRLGPDFYETFRCSRGVYEQFHNFQSRGRLESRSPKGSKNLESWDRAEGLFVLLQVIKLHFS